MVFGKKDQLVGLDIGSRSIKVAEIVETKRGRTLKHFGIVDIPHGAIEEGTIKDPEAVSETLQQLFKSYRIKESNVAVSIGGYSVIVKKINVQTMAEEQLQETIATEINSQLLGKTAEVLVEGKKRGKWQGRTRSGKLVFFTSDSDCLGQLMQIRINKTSPWSLQGKFEAVSTD